MDKELALRTFGYLIGHYKTHNETTINKQEIEAIEFILKDNEFLEQQCKKQKEVIDKAIEYIEKNYYSKNTFDIDNIGMTTNKLLQVRNILKEVSE